MLLKTISFCHSIVKIREKKEKKIQCERRKIMKQWSVIAHKIPAGYSLVIFFGRKLFLTIGRKATGEVKVVLEFAISRSFGLLSNGMS